MGVNAILFYTLAHLDAIYMEDHGHLLCNNVYIHSVVWCQIYDPVTVQ